MLGVQPETVLVMCLVNTVVNRVLGVPATFTSVTDDAKGRHSNSLHKYGHAFDLRTWDPQHQANTGFIAQLSADRKEYLANQIRNAIPDYWQVIIKSSHIHIENNHYSKNYG